MPDAPPVLSGQPPAKSWLAATGQRWKFWVYMTATLLATPLILGDVLGFGRVSGYLEYPRAIFAVVLLGILSVAWLVLSVRCKHCGGYPTWFLMTTAPASRWLSTLLTASCCPKCGNQPEPAGRHVG